MNFYQVLQMIIEIQNGYAKISQLKKQINTLQALIDSRTKNEEQIKKLQETIAVKELLVPELLAKIDKEQKSLLDRISQIPSLEGEGILIIKQILHDIINEYSDKPMSQILSPIVLPKELQYLSQYLHVIDPAIYAALFPYAKLAELLENQGLAEHHALNLSAIFNNKQKALEYLIKCAEVNNVLIKENRFKLMAEAAEFSLPDLEKCNFKLWQEFAQRIEYLLSTDFRTIFPMAHLIEKRIQQDAAAKRLKKEDKKLASAQKAEIKRIKALLQAKQEAWKKLKSHHGTLTPEERDMLANLNKEISDLRVQLSYAYTGIPLERADLDMLRAYSERHMIEVEAYRYLISVGLTRQDYFEKFIKLNRSKASANIPDITINGDTLGFPGYYLKKVNPQNTMEAARAAVFGLLVKCCQSITGELGEPCAIHSLTSANGGLYLLCQGDANNPKMTDRVCGGSWTWRSKKGNLVFDSIEAHPDFTEEQGLQMVKTMFNELAYQIVEQTPITQVNCGSKSGISNMFGTPTSSLGDISPEEFTDYAGFSDAKNQQVVTHKQAPYLQWSTHRKPQLTKEIVNFIAHQFKINPATPFKKILPLKQMIEFAILNKHEDLVDILKKECQFSPEIFDELNDYAEKIEKFSKCQRKYFITKKPAEREKIYSDLESLINQDVDVNIVIPEFKCNLLFRAIKQKDLYLVSKLLSRKDVDVNKIIEGTSALRLAFHLNVSPEIIKLLLAREIDLNSTGAEGKSSLIYAVEHSNEVNLKLLLEKKPNLMIKDLSGKTAFDYAKNNPQIFAILQEHQNLMSKQKPSGPILRIALQQQPIPSSPKVQEYDYLALWVDLDQTKNEIDALMSSVRSNQRELDSFSKKCLIHIQHFFDMHGTSKSDNQHTAELKLNALKKLLNHLQDTQPHGKLLDPKVVSIMSGISKIISAMPILPVKQRAKI